MRTLFFAGVMSAVGLLLWQAAADKARPANESGARAPGFLSVADFLPRDHVTDGSVSYQQALQKAIDAAAREGCTLVFPPMRYQLDESGVQLRSRSHLRLDGAVFSFGPTCSKDGQAFAGADVQDIDISGGAIVGRNDVWPEGVNIRGIYITGSSKNIRIRDLHIRNLSSNGIGIFGTAKEPIRDVWLSDLVIENCCNRYGDYLSDKPGPEKNSKREDQGLIALYHVDDFVVRGCRLEKSRSDGTHFYRCRHGQFVHNKVYTAQMGGYFVESCEDVLASDSIMRGNGSRGVTIERGSRNCTLTGCTIAQSGREGLWAPNCTGLVITANVFDRNGRKPNGKQPHQIWNANITINTDRHDPTKSATEDYVIGHNILYTTSSQVAAVRIDADDRTTGIALKDNLLRGEQRQIIVAGPRAKTVLLRGNE